MTTIALFGAAGKIGARIASSLRDDPEYHVLYVEAGEAGLARLGERGLEPSDKDKAVREADVVILAVPDVLIGVLAAEIELALLGPIDLDRCDRPTIDRRMLGRERW